MYGDVVLLGTTSPDGGLLPYVIFVFATPSGFYEFRIVRFLNCIMLSIEGFLNYRYSVKRFVFAAHCRSLSLVVRTSLGTLIYYHIGGVCQ
jgi:hypothetical protein